MTKLDWFTVDFFSWSNEQVISEVSGISMVSSSLYFFMDKHPDLSNTPTSQISQISMVSSSLDFFMDKHLDLSNTPTLQISQIKRSKIRALFSNFHFRKLQLVPTEEDHLEDILREQRQHLIWLSWYEFSHSSLPNLILMTKLRVMEM